MMLQGILPVPFYIFTFGSVKIVHFGLVILRLLSQSENVHLGLSFRYFKKPDKKPGISIKVHTVLSQIIKRSELIKIIKSDLIF